eukprot:TRINITY_DN23154_c0_g1_i1.p1 TRINITY_DN23154_c0_g1~~TRINITY_DN23154_c0_g1_i1.p1  ORF type:complete len:136 (-),score=21.12 TRINITY_DN23154_c0_g1_i1:134-541(-)
MVRFEAIIAALLFTSAGATLDCSGGSVAVCECLLGCDVFGSGNPKQCSTAEDPNVLVDKAVRASLEKANTECRGIKCVTHCAKKLNCLDHAVIARCMNVKAMRPECDAKCDDGSNAHSAGPLFALAVALFSAVSY